MKPILIRTCLAATLLLGPFYTAVSAQVNETEDVMVALDNYIIGSSYNYPEKIKAAFYPEADMFLDHPDKPIFLMKPESYAGGVAKREPGKFNGRHGKVISLDIEGNIAIAKAEILMPEYESLYIDYFLLKKLEGKWKIISKAAGRADSSRSGNKTLLIATDKGAGEDFSDLISDYETAVATGYTVNFASPNGGAVAFNGLDMENPKHRDYIYSADFMYALENTMAAADVTASDYISANYVCDKDAKNSASGHSGIDKLYSEICTGDTQCEG